MYNGLEATAENMLSVIPTLPFFFSSNNSTVHDDDLFQIQVCERTCLYLFMSPGAYLRANRKQIGGDFDMFRYRGSTARSAFY